MSQPNEVVPAEQMAQPSELNLAKSQSMAVKLPAVDPYELNFRELKNKYVENTTQKLRFSKPSFLHYCKNPYTYGAKYGGADTMLTMEIVQAPNGLKYKNLEDPTRAKKLAKEQKEKERFEKMEAEEKARAEQEEKDAENEDEDEDKDDEDEDKDDDDEDKDDEVSAYGDDLGDDDEDEDEDDDSYGDDYGDDDEDDDDDDDDDDYDDERDPDQEREYEGNMFKKKAPLKFVLADRELRGEKRVYTQSTDYVLISVWRIGKANIRFSRLADVFVPFPPVTTDQRFYCSHSADAIYWLTMQDGKQSIVTLNLGDFKWSVFDFSGEDIPALINLNDSSLICDNQGLIIKNKEGYTQKRPNQLSGDFGFYDLWQKQRIATFTNVERVMFSGVGSLEAGMEKLEEEKSGTEIPAEKDGSKLQENSADKRFTPVREQSLQECIKDDSVSKPENMLVLKLSVKEVEVEKSGSEKAADKLALKENPEKEIKPKMETQLFYSFYKGELPSSYEEGERELSFQHSIPTTLPITETEEEAQEAKEKDEGLLAKGGNFLMNAMTSLMPANMKAAVQEVQEDGLSARARAERAGKKPECIYAVDCDFTELVMIVIGGKGETHQVLQFDCESGGEDDLKPKRKSQRPGNFTLSTNENTFLRTISEFYIIQTSTSGDTSAKIIQALAEESAKMPEIEMKEVDKNYAMDVWMQYFEDDKNNSAIQSISKSNADEYLNVSSMRIAKIMESEIIDPKVLATLKTNFTKIKNQEMQVQYPVVACNIGVSIINVQSCAQPDIHSQFKLDPGSDFICFVNYNKLTEIGFEDPRSKMLKARIPTDETGQYIAFLTRVQGACDASKEDECKTGDLLLNILFIDSYSEPMTFTLYTTDYEACMMEGCRDDVIHKAFALEVKSARSTDVTLCIQYNDSIVFDCITSTKQRPIMFPMTRAKLDKEGCIYEEIKATLDVTIVPVPMMMDEQGFIFLIVQNKDKQISIYRVNTEKEMGEDSMFQLVYQFQSNWVYFFVKNDDKFYLMDSSKKIRVLVQDAKTSTLSVSQVLALNAQDREEIRPVPYAEFSVSSGCIHYRDKAMFMVENSQSNNQTWEQFPVGIKGYDPIAGPKNAQGSGLIYYVEEAQSVTSKSKNELDEKEIAASKPYGEFCLVFQPKADLSFMSCIPIGRENMNNFCSFIDTDRLMIQYGGRFLVFNTRGDFFGQVEFVKAPYINVTRMRLESFCDSKKYFVFIGPEQLPPEPKSKDKDKQKSLIDVKKPAPGPPKLSYYIFYLEFIQKTFGDGRKSFYRLTHKVMPITPVNDPQIRRRSVALMNPSGYFDLTSLTKVEPQPGVNNQFVPGQPIKFTVELQTASAFQDQKFGKDLIRIIGDEPDPVVEPEVKTFTFDFVADNLIALQENVKNQLLPLEKAKYKSDMLKIDFPEQADYERMKERQVQFCKAWKCGNYMIAKCGTDLQFAHVDTQAAQTFNFDLGTSVWLQGVYLTGVEGLVQFYVINDEERQVFAITWNMDLNREHSLFQTTYKPGQLPENLILQSFSTNTVSNNFNFCLEDGCIVNLENNIPCQFFDPESEGDLVPHGALRNTVRGQKKISEDKQKYLDMLQPGRVQHFISFTDLLYWERYTTNKNRHELSKGKVSSFSPIARFPEGISIFHRFATDEKVINTFRLACESAVSQKTDDKRIGLLPLMFLHKMPTANKQGQRPTPLQVSLDKQSPSCFEMMMSMLTTQTGVCVTGNMLGKLPDIIGLGSPAVQDLFNTAFRVTDQLEGPRPINWPGAEEELYLNVPTAFLTNETIQSLVYEKMNYVEAPEDEEAPPEEIDAGSKELTMSNGFRKYSVAAIEEVVTFDEAENTVKQVECKLLDFDWIFTGDNAANMMKVLAETSNDEIFATQQIRVLIEFLWGEYYGAIYSTLFIPFMMYFTAFNLYATQFAATQGNVLDFAYVMKWICLVVWGKTFVTFFLLELIQFKADPVNYFSSFWNMLDFASILICPLYVFFAETNQLQNLVGFNINILGSIAVVILWMKLFYWLRLFKPFSAFIRIISEIANDIQIFTAMLMLCLAAFANVLMVLQDNRNLNGQSAIYDSYVGFGPADALIHAYLTGLGDFNKDNYSDGNSTAVWIFFLGATVLVQLVFMNMLIAIMGESFGRITAITEQSVMKELCTMMNDNMWLLNMSEIFSSSRYILWLTPGANKPPGTLIERQIEQLRSYIEERSDGTDNKVASQNATLIEQIDGMKTMLEALVNKDKINEDEDMDDEEMDEDMF